MRYILNLLSAFIITITIVACTDKQGDYISSIIPMAENEPDSALKELRKIDQTELSDKNYALYSLIYTMAQDKSCIDVDNDSLIRIAYNWYKDKPSDSLYAKCEYYMGKYYSLNDSSEKALQCFSNAIKAANRQKDYYTQSLALQHFSVIIRDYNPNLAIRYAKETINQYKKVRNGQKANKIYALLNLAEAYSFDNKDKLSIRIAKQAGKLAINLNDSLAIADVFQDLSVFYNALGIKDSAFFYARKNFITSKSNEPSAIFAMSQAYYNVDSIYKAERFAKYILKLDKENYKAAAYSLLLSIAIKGHETIKAEEYKDSLISSLESINCSNSQKKDKYYSVLIQKEELRSKAIEASNLKTFFIITITVTFILVIILINHIYLSRRKKAQILNQKEQEKKQLIIEHQEIQISTMRKFLIHKIKIIQKLNNLKSNNHKYMILDDEDWNELIVFLNNFDNYFVSRLKEEFPKLTTKDLHFLMLIRIKMPYHDIASIYNIEVKSVKQKLFLLKNKLGLNGSQKSTREFIETY